MLPQLVTILYCLSLTAFFLSNKNGHLARFFLLSRKGNICSSVSGSLSLNLVDSALLLNFLFLFFFFALLVLKRLNKMAVTIIHLSHQGSNCC